MNMESRNKQFGFKRFLNSFKNSVEGLKYAYGNEQSMFVHAIATIFSILLGIILKIDRNEWIVVIALLMSIAMLELMNTAVEAVCDAVTLERNSLIKISKDTASAAVFLASVVTAIIFLLIFVPKVIAIIGA